MSNTDGGTISAGQDLRLIGPDDLIVPLACGFHYSRQDPYAIKMSLDAGRAEPVEWTFGRDLLAAALKGPEGIGDVRAWPSSAAAEGAAEKTLNIELGPPAGCARFKVGAAGVETFLARTYELVPVGQETDFLNLDAGLAELLDQA
jgi:Streptomyces sporulation and cell division protein, SsgA